MNNTTSTIRPSDTRNACRRADRAWRHGFSIVELTVVLVIIAISAGIVIPRYGGSLARYRVDMSAKRLAADLALAQSSARATGTFQQVRFSGVADGYQLPEQTGMAQATTKMTVLLNTSPFFTAITSAKDGNGATLTLLKFDGYGQPDQSATIKLKSGIHTRTVTVDRVSGAINVATP